MTKQFLRISLFSDGKLQTAEVIHGDTWREKKILPF
jgi:hypothetical protein